MIESVQNIPVVKRIHAMTLLPLLGVYMLLSVLVWAMLDSMAIRELENKGRQIIASTGSLLQGALISGDENAAKALVEPIANDEDIVAIKVVKVDNPQRFVEAKGIAHSTAQPLILKDSILRETLNDSLWEKPDDQNYQKTLGYVELTLSTHRIRGEVNRTLRNIAIAGAVVLALAILLGRLIGNSILMPLRQITTSVARITQGDYSESLDLRSHDEFGALGDDINAMAIELGEQKGSIEDQLQQLVASREEMVLLDERKTALLTNITREYSKPLTASIGNLQKAMRLNKCPEITPFVKTALDHVNYLSELNVDVEQLARLDSAQVNIRNAPVLLARLLASVIDSYRSEFEEKGIDIVVDWGAHEYLAHETIYSDPIRLRVILNNLLGYAAKSMQVGNGEIVVRVFLRKDCEYVNIMVDFIFCGAGGDEQRASPALDLNRSNGIDVLDDETSGSGVSLELRTAQQVAESMGGTLNVYSTLPGEPRVSLELVVAYGAVEVQESVADASDLHKIMIVEQYRRAQDIAVNYLRTQGLGVDHFTNGAEAIQAASLYSYTMIFIDGQLSDMSGQRVAKGIRALPAYVQTPLIAIVDENDCIEAESNIDTGFDDQLRKPMTGRLLFELVEGHRNLNTAIDSFLR